MTESLRQESLIELSPEKDGRQLRLPCNRVIAVCVNQQASFLWTPPEENPILGDVVIVGEPRLMGGNEIPQEVLPGDRIVIPPHIGVKILWEGQPALIMREDEVLAVVEETPCLM